MYMLYLNCFTRGKQGSGKTKVLEG